MAQEEKKEEEHQKACNSINQKKTKGLLKYNSILNENVKLEQ